MSDRHNGQLDEWLDSNHYDGCQRECSQRLLERESLGEDKKKKKRRTLYKHPAWNRFLQVLQGFFGSDPSIVLMILSTTNVSLYGPRRFKKKKEVTHE